MKEFWIRMASLIMIVAALFGYNTVLDAREKDEEIAKLSAQLQESEMAGGSEAEEAEYKDGTYTGEADGFGGAISVEVKIEDGEITELNILSAEKEDGAYLSMAEDIIPRILEAQSVDVDTVSGATFSSTGIRDASAQALEKAVK
ncbi:MAG: FMN-binding protein [Blautia sp.]|nr:FMN-binding protein [Blautia sp.]